MANTADFSRPTSVAETAVTIARSAQGGHLRFERLYQVHGGAIAVTSRLADVQAVAAVLASPFIPDKDPEVDQFLDVPLGGWL